MKLLLIFFLVLKVYSQICVNEQATGDIISAGSSPYNWSIKAVTQIYNAQDNLVAFTTFTSTGPYAHHYGEIKIYDLSTQTFGPSAELKDNMGETEYALAEYLVNLPNSNYISVQVNWSNKFYVRTFDLSLNTISIIYNQNGRIFYPGNNGNLIFIPNGYILQLYNVVTSENYQNISTATYNYGNITWACESANYYIITFDTGVFFYDMNGVYQSIISPLDLNQPIQVKPYYHTQSGTMIATTQVYALWNTNGTFTVTNINTEDFSIANQLAVSQGNFCNCATGSPTNWELICADDSSIMYMLNNTIQNTTAECTHFHQNKLFTTINSIYYSNSNFGITYDDFDQCGGSNNK